MISIWLHRLGEWFQNYYSIVPHIKVDEIRISIQISLRRRNQTNNCNLKGFSQTCSVLKNSYLNTQIPLFMQSIQVDFQTVVPIEISIISTLRKNRSMRPSSATTKVRKAIHMVEVAVYLFNSYCSFTSVERRNKFFKTCSGILQAIYAVFKVLKTIKREVMQEKEANGFQLSCSQEVEDYEIFILSHLFQSHSKLCTALRTKWFAYLKSSSWPFSFYSKTSMDHIQPVPQPLPHRG